MPTPLSPKAFSPTPEIFSEVHKAYRFGFNGKERDNHGMGGGGSTYDYGFRIYNGQIGKFLSVDPLTKSYPWYTPYQFAGNKPIWAIDLDGLEEYVVHLHTFQSSRGLPIIYKIDYKKIPYVQRAEGFGNGTYLIDANNSNIFATDYEYSFFYSKRNDITRDNSSVIYKSITSKNNKSGTVNLNFNMRLSFDPDKGKSVDEIANKVQTLDGSQKDHLDAIVGVLVNDPLSKLTVTGYASPKPTNIENQESSTTTENNNELASLRAEAGAKYIIKYAKEKYNTDINPSRINVVNGGIRNSDENTNNSADNANDRAVNFEIK